MSKSDDSYGIQSKCVGAMDGGISGKDRIAPLTSLRFFAAFFVVFYHLQGVVIPMPSINQMALGVSFFFVLSGFILSTVYPDATKMSLPRFYASRLARLWPVHALCVFAVVFAYDTAMLTDGFWLPKVLTNLGMLHAWIPQYGYVFSLNSVSWSISAEFGFYLLFPALAASRQVGKVVILIGILVAIGLFLLEFNHATVWSEDPWKFSAVLLVSQSPFARLFEFAVGVWAARVFRERRYSGFIARHANVFEVGAILLLLAFGVFSRYVVAAVLERGFHIFGSWLDVAGGVLVFAFMIFVFAHSAGALSRGLSNRVLVFLGEASFALYMVHQLIIKYAMTKGWTTLLSWPLTLLLLCLVIGITSVAVYVLWERPMRRLVLQAHAVLSNRMKAIRQVVMS